MSPSRKCRPRSARAQNLLPQDLPAPPIYAKVNPADAPVLTLGVTSKVMPLTEVEDLADTRIAQKISQIKGVGVVSISGGQRPAVRVVVNPRALAAYGLNLDDLRTTINDANQNGPKGTLDGPANAYTVNTNDQIRNADDYGNIVVAYSNGAPVRLKDVATLVDGAENTKLGGWMNSTPGADPQRAAPAGRQRRRCGRSRSTALLPTLQADTARGRGRDAAHRPHHHHPRLDQGRRVRTDPGGGAGGAGHLCCSCATCPPP